MVVNESGSGKDYQITPSILTDPFSINHREIEPNNTFSQGNTFFLTNGEVYSGQLHSISDIDVFEYYISGAGLLSFWIKPENTNFDGYQTRVTIKDSNSTILASKYFNSQSTGINLAANVVISGYYYLVVDESGSGKDYQITPNSVFPGTVVINADPDSINAPWTMTGPGGYSQTGMGDQTLTNLTPGDYVLTWGNVSGWTKPKPSPSTQALASGGTITFIGTYTPRKPGFPWLLPLLLAD